MRPRKGPRPEKEGGDGKDAVEGGDKEKEDEDGYQVEGGGGMSFSTSDDDDTSVSIPWDDI